MKINLLLLVIAFSFSLHIVSAQVITTNGTLTLFSSCSGIASGSQNFDFSANGLTTSVSITAPSGFQVSLSSNSGFSPSLNINHSSGIIASTTVYTRAFTTASVSGNITVSSAGASTKNVAVSATVISPPSIITQSQSKYVCGDSGTFLVVPNTNLINYQWQTKTYPSGWVDINSSQGMYAGFNDSMLTIQASVILGATSLNDFQNGPFRCKLSNGCGIVYSDSVILTKQTRVWTGASDTDWNNSANWECIESSSPSATNVYIPGYTLKNVVISNNANTSYLIIDSAKTVTLNNYPSFDIYGEISGSGKYDGSKGTTRFLKNSPIWSIPNGEYFNLFSWAAFSFVDSLKITNSITGSFRNSSEIIIDSNATYTNAQFMLEQKGKLTIRNIGIGGRTGNITFPISFNLGTVTPVIINNTGVADDFTLSFADSVCNSYNGNTPTGLKINLNAVGRTWFINEATLGGSNAAVTLQWFSNKELQGFTRNNCYISYYNGSYWNPFANQSASGSSLYSITQSGITSFGPFGIGSSGTLPVMLAGFNGLQINADVKLEWNTANETNNKEFVVERSYDGFDWKEISIIKGSVNTASPRSYIYMDMDACSFEETNLIYYRLYQTDMNGMKALVGETKVKAGRTNNDPKITVQPNPFNELITLNFTSTSYQTNSLLIFDITGKEIMNQAIEIVEGNNKINIDMSSFSKGIYYMQFEGRRIKIVKGND